MILGGIHKGPEKPLLGTVFEPYDEADDDMNGWKPAHRMEGEPCEDRNCDHIADCVNVPF